MLHLRMIRRFRYLEVRHRGCCYTVFTYLIFAQILQWDAYPSEIMKYRLNMARFKKCERENWHMISAIHHAVNHC